MKIDHESQIIVCKKDYENLLSLKGRINAAQEYVNNSDIIFIDTLCHIIGIDMTAHKQKIIMIDKKEDDVNT